MTRHLAVPLRLSARCLSKGASTALSNFKTESPPVTQQDSTPLWGQLEKLFSSSNLCTILHEALWTFKDSICFIEWITSPLQCKIVLGRPSYFWRVLQRVFQFWCMSSAWKTSTSIKAKHTSCKIAIIYLKKKTILCSSIMSSFKSMNRTQRKLYIVTNAPVVDQIDLVSLHR